MRWLAAALLLAALGQERRPQARTFGEKTGFKPLCCMGADDRHQGEDGGLYGGGQNRPPAAHAEAATAAAAEIRPLDLQGRPAKDGRIVLASIGMSNTTQEFGRFQRLVPRGDGALAVVDGAQGGQAAIQWNTPEAKAWAELDRRLGAAGVAAPQVQVVWIKQALIQQGQYGEYPAHAKRLQEELGKIVRIAKARFPNLRLAYLSSRIYAGWARSNLNPEPYAYEGAFAVRGLIREQIQGAADLRSPVLLWGPYLWADGVTPRPCDGLQWKESDLGKDGTHPSDDGKTQVARQLLAFFRAEPTAKSWFPAGP